MCFDRDVMWQTRQTVARAGFCLSALIAVAWVTVASAAAIDWVELGPAPVTSTLDTGRIAALAASPTDPNRFYAGAASGGVWRTTDGGLNWTPLTDHMPAAAIGALAMDPADENVLYAGTGEANYANHSLYGLGIYKTTD